MIKHVLSGLCAVTAIFAVAQNEPQTLETQISEVTVYADRALVSRTATQAIPKGESVWFVDGLPAWIDVGSVRVDLAPQGGTRIADVQVTMAYHAKADDKDISALDKVLSDLDEGLQDIRDELSLLTARRSQVERISEYNIEKLPRDAAMRDIPVQTYREVVEFVSSERREILSKQRALEKKLRELEPERAAKAKSRDELQRLVRLEFSSIVLTVQAEQDAEIAFTVKYMTPGAAWEPAHEMRLLGDDKVQFASYARVSQTTGEDWERAKIFLSTQSPSKAMRIPKLEALMVGGVPSNLALRQGAGKASSFDVAARYFAGNNEWVNVANGVVAGPRQSAMYRSNFDAQVMLQEGSIRSFNRLQQRGTTALYLAGQQKSIRSDGTPVRLPIDQQLIDGDPMLVAAPEVSLNVTRTVDLVNKSEKPILPGKVALFNDGGFVGSTRVEFVGVGESFSMFAGIDDEVKISRVLDHETSEIVRGRKTNKITAAFVTTIENLSSEPLSVRLADRIPVSDEKSIKVSGVILKPRVEPNDDGLLLWDTLIEANEKIYVLLAYTVEYPNDLVELRKQSLSGEAGMPDSSFEQIERLESLF